MCQNEIRKVSLFLLVIVWVITKWATFNRFGQKTIYKIGFGVFVLTLSPLFARFYNTLYMLFVSPYNNLLFLPKTNKENDNNIDFSLSKKQNLKKYSSILD
jgi:hypothetical protein